MKQLIFIFCILLAAIGARAQDKSIKDMQGASNANIKKDPNDTIPARWKTGGLFNLTFNQAALSNWATGGEPTALSLASSLYAYAFWKEGRHAWDNTINLALGGNYTTSQGIRKTDDRIDLLSKYGYALSKNWFLSTLFNFRSQFAAGRAYPKDAPPVLTSDFLSPAYILLSEGLNYKPNDNFSFFISPTTVRWLIVKDDSLSSVGAFGVDSGKNVKTEFGAFASVAYAKKFSETVSYVGRIDFFSNYLHDPQNIDINMTNLLAVKVAEWLAITFQFNLVYDNDVRTVNSDGTVGGPKLQIQELFGIGISLKFQHRSSY